MPDHAGGSQFLSKSLCLWLLIPYGQHTAPSLAAALLLWILCYSPKKRMYVLPGKAITQVFNRQPSLFLLLLSTTSMEQMRQLALALSSAFLNLHSLRDHTFFTTSSTSSCWKGGTSDKKRVEKATFICLHHQDWVSMPPWKGSSSCTIHTSKYRSL